MIYKILLDHKKLEEERNPDKNVNKVTKGFLLFYMLFWIGYLLLIGTMLPFAFEGIFPNMEPYNIFNGWMITVFALDFLIRFTYQKAPSQNIKGYILYPIGKKKLVNFMILYSLKRWMNLLWLFFTVPFIYLSTVRFFGVAATLHYNICFMILILCNDLFFSISKTLMNKHILWLLLPLSFFGLTVGLMFLPDSPLYKFYMDFGEGMITGSWWTYAASLLLLAAMWTAARRTLSHEIQNEISKEDKTKVLKISEYGFMDRFGEKGSFMKLEMKMLLRNKRCRNSLLSGIAVIIMFSIFLMFDIYESDAGTTFLATYNFIVLGLMMLSGLMSFEGNYIDGLLVRKDSLLTLLKAKYLFYSAATLLPLLLMLPAVFMDKVSFLSLVGYLFFTCGPVYFIVFQLAVYNRSTTQLNATATMKNNSTNGIQIVINMTGMLLPMLVYSVLGIFMDDTTAAITMIMTGIIFILTNDLWIKNIYNRFNKRKYRNLEGFRATR